MPNASIYELVKLSNSTMQDIVFGEEKWTSFLQTAAHNYKYSFAEQLLIHAAQPSATACAQMGVWNKLGRVVSGNSQGIALLDCDEKDNVMDIKYVFDVSDTYTAKNTNFSTWRLSADYAKNIFENSAEQTILKMCEAEVENAFEIYFDECYALKENSFIEILQRDDARTIFRETALASVKYIVFTRCELAIPEELSGVFEANIFNFNTPETVRYLGKAVQSSSENILRNIEKLVKIEYNKNKVTVPLKGQQIVYNNYNKFEMEKDYARNQNGMERNAKERNNLHSGGRILDTRLQVATPTREFSAEPLWQGEERISDGTQGGSIHGDDSGLQSDVAPERSAGASGQNVSSARKNAESAQRSDRTTESERPNGIRPPVEHGTSRSTPNSVRPSNIRQLSFFDSVETQIAKTEKAEDITSSAFLFSDDIINTALTSGTGTKNGKLRVVEFFSGNHTVKEKAVFLKNECGYYGYYSKGEIGLNYDAKGLVLRNGFDDDSKLFLSYSDIAKRIDYLIKSDKYLLDEEKAVFSPTKVASEHNKSLVAEMLREAQIGNDFYNGNFKDDESKVTIVGKQIEVNGRKIYVDRIDEENNTAIVADVAIMQGGIAVFGEENLDIIKEAYKKKQTESAEQIEQPKPTEAAETVENFRITDDNLGVSTKKEKYEYNFKAIKLLKKLELEGKNANKDQQEILSKFVGFGGIPEAFDQHNSAWSKEHTQIKELLTDEEFSSARESTLNAHYTSPIIIKSMYKALENLGFKSGNILEPSCGVGNFFGMIPKSMANSKLYGVELDSLTGRIGKQLYPSANIEIKGFERTNKPDNFFDIAVGNVPFGDYCVADKWYDKYKFRIHDYFFAKTLDKVRPGGVIAFITSKGTLDKKNSGVRRYLAQRADLLGAIRLPNTAFKANAGTSVTSDIIFLQKRESMRETLPDWVEIGETDDGLSVNKYFENHPEMVLGKMILESTRFGHDTTCEPLENADLAEQLDEAISNIYGNIPKYEREVDEIATIPADENVRNYSFCVKDDKIYYRENGFMKEIFATETVKERIKSLINIRDAVRQNIMYQTEDYSDDMIAESRQEMNAIYDDFAEKYGRINSKVNEKAFGVDSSYPLLSSLEVVDDKGEFSHKADIFSKRTIRRKTVITHADTPLEALLVSLNNNASVDLDYMENLTGTEKDKLINELDGIIFRNPLRVTENGEYLFETAGECLSGNVREKLEIAKAMASGNDTFKSNVLALEKVVPKDIPATEIDVRLGSTWVPKKYVERFMHNLLDTPLSYRINDIKVSFTEFTSEWNVSGKNIDSYNVKANTAYGTKGANAYKIIEDTLNLKDTRIFDYQIDENGNKKAVLNAKQTAIAQSKQDIIKTAFKDFIFKDIHRREDLVQIYNDRFNSVVPREYDGSHLSFDGMNAEINLYPHQKNAIARAIYGGNTLLAHVVGAGKTFEMTAVAMESKRIGLCEKSLFVVPNHLTKQWASDFMELYPSANILAATKKDFEKENRKKFCSRIATGDYDAVIIGHSQFEKIPMSPERQREVLEEELDNIIAGIRETKNQRGENFTIKQLESTKKKLEVKIEKLGDSNGKDDVITFEQLGVDRLFVDEAHGYKNLFLFTKMRNVAGISQSESQKASDMYMKTRYMDEITGGKGVIFATGTPISNSMTEMYTMQRYLQRGTLEKQKLLYFDAWASTFGETTTSIELAPDGSGYRAKTRFAKFFNLPELMTTFKEVADIKTADMLDLPVPKAIFHVETIKPSAEQQTLVKSLSERAELVRRKEVKPWEDNMLCITNDGRKLALDQRLVNPLLPDDGDSKTMNCAKNVHKIYSDYAEIKGTQLVFCDLSTPKYNGNYSVYDDLKSKLIKMGIDEHEIAFIHDANNEKQKEELFAKVRSGTVRVLIGSTQRMGAGTNVQDRLIATHDLDCPWRPSDLEQRAGRIIRQGNMNKEVHIYRYVTESTFDAYLYQTVENKQKFISQIMTGKSPVRSADDIDESVLSYAEIKALATGNPMIKEKMDLELEVGKLNLMKSNYLNEKHEMEHNLLNIYPKDLALQKYLVNSFAKDIETAKANPLNEERKFAPMTIGDTTYRDKDLAGNKILLLCKEAKIESGNKIQIGNYRGFAMELAYSLNGNRDFHIILKGCASHKVKLGDDAFGNLQRINNVIETLPEKLCEAKADYANTLAAQKATEENVDKPFALQSKLDAKNMRLANVNALLNLDEKEQDVAVENEYDFEME